MCCCAWNAIVHKQLLTYFNLACCDQEGWPHHGPLKVVLRKHWNRETCVYCWQICTFFLEFFTLECSGMSQKCQLQLGQVKGQIVGKFVTFEPSSNVLVQFYPGWAAGSGPTFAFNYICTFLFFSHNWNPNLSTMKFIVLQLFSLPCLNHASRRALSTILQLQIPLQIQSVNILDYLQHKCLPAKL